MEILVYPGDRIAYGDKLNRMFAEAQGEWVVDLGDDDWLSGAYLGEVVGLLEDENPDYLGYKFAYLEDDEFQYEIAHRGDVVGWPSPDLRGVCQKCPVRTSIARKVPFGNDYTDDRVWSYQVGDIVESHVFVDRVLYYYDHHMSEYLGTSPEHRPEAWQDTNRVGTWKFKDWGNIRWLDGP